jgi:tetratricopeptide (TPR) repeat protein
MVASEPQALEGRVWEFLDRGDVKQAISACEQLNKQFPDYPPGWHTASQLALKLGSATMALGAIRQALAEQPDNPAWLLQEARCLSKLGSVKEVESRLERLVAMDWRTAYEFSAMGLLLTDLGQREEAVSYYEKAVKLKPEDARNYFNIACLQRTLGQFDKAEKNFDKTVDLNPSDYEAYKLRSELRTQTAENNHVQSLEKVLEAGISDHRGKANICYALAKELEDIGEPERSFTYLKQGADTRRGQMQYDAGRDLATIATIQDAFSAEVFESASSGDSSAEPIFILGMPRTGTTLAERILARHTDIHAAGELTNFAKQMMSLVQSKAAGRELNRDALVRLSTEIDFAKLGAAYVGSTRPFTGYTRHFTDKLPLNYLYVGLIHLALPDAKIINLRRHPMDTCYSVYKNLFVDAYPFSYDLEELAQYYVAYDRLMKHWNDVLPDVICTVHYEELVNNVEAESRRLVEYCGLEWQPDCLTFYESDEASTTASAAQVRKPVYRSSIGRWRNYEQQLQPVVKILEDAGIPLDG